MDELIIEDRPLKDFFRLFDNDEKLEICELGDTWHPASGFIDETYFKNITTVNELLSLDYDFIGLVIFIAKIRGLTIYYQGNYYTLKGDKKEIEKIRHNGLPRLNV